LVNWYLPWYFRAFSYLLLIQKTNREVSICTQAIFHSAGTPFLFIRAELFHQPGSIFYRRMPMPKKKFYPPNDTGTKKRCFRCLLFQRPKAYPNRPRSNKNNLIKPIRRA
jgi:hypothetical protein